MPAAAAWQRLEGIRTQLDARRPQGWPLASEPSESVSAPPAAAALVAGSAPAPTPLPDACGQFAAAHAYANELASSGRAHGLALAVGRAGRVIYSAALGRSAPTPAEGGLLPDTPIRTDSIFEVASVTKPFTVLAVLQLIERLGGSDGKGSFTLETPVCQILPAFGGPPTAVPAGEDEHHAQWRQRRDGVTLRHLMTHTSGLGDGIPVDRSTQPSLGEHLAAIYTSAALQFEPGSDICYSSQAIMLLAAVVEAVSGLPLPVYLRENVFLPLGMTDTTLGIAAERQPAREVTMHFESVAENRHWDHNSTYWRSLGAPWGGLLT